MTKFPARIITANMFIYKQHYCIDAFLCPNLLGPPNCIYKYPFKVFRVVVTECFGALT